MRVDIDTMLSGFNRDYIFFQNESIGNVYLGNLGGAVMPLNFFDRRQASPFTFLDAYSAYHVGTEQTRRGAIACVAFAEHIALLVDKPHIP